MIIILNDNESIIYDQIFQIVSDFDPSTDIFTDLIECPKNNENFIHYSNDETKLDDWKADVMSKIKN